MKISYEKHGVEGIENCLAYLAAFDADDIESDEFEIMGEDEGGREGSADISIINLAEEACRALAAQRKCIAQLERERDAYRTAEEHQIALRQKMEEDRDALAAHVERIKDCFKRTELPLPGIFQAEIYQLFAQSPTTSLASRDADILEYMASEIKSMHPKASKDGIAAHLSCVATSYRQKAEAEQ